MRMWIWGMGWAAIGVVWSNPTPTPEYFVILLLGGFVLGFTKNWAKSDA